MLGSVQSLTWLMINYMQPVEKKRKHSISWNVHLFKSTTGASLTVVSSFDFHFWDCPFVELDSVFSLSRVKNWGTYFL